jgi:rubrerythrin
MTIQKEIKEALKESKGISLSNFHLATREQGKAHDKVRNNAPTWLLHQQELIEQLQRQLGDMTESRDYFQREMNNNFELFCKAVGETIVLQKEKDNVHAWREKAAREASQLRDIVEQKDAEIEREKWRESHMDLEVQVHQQAEEIRKLREALEWYANADNHNKLIFDKYAPYVRIDEDNGERARVALSQLTPIKGDGETE